MCGPDRAIFSLQGLTAPSKVSNRMFGAWRRRLRSKVGHFPYLALVAIGLRVPSAHAAKTKDEAAARFEQKAVQVYIGGAPATATRTLEQVLRSCEPPGACSA